MAGSFLWFAGLAAFALSSQPERTLPPAETVIRLNVRPAPAPKPALRYLLLPELKEMTPGNPIPNYLKCFLDQDFSAEQETLGRSSLRQAARAARMSNPDWQILLKLRTDGISLLLPDVQKLRGLATALQERFRDEVARRRFDDALVTAKTMFALSRHMSEHPTLIGDLVGIAIAYVTIDPLEEMLRQPGCPNLYWALTNLPRPLVPLDKGMEGERMFILTELRDLDDKAPMTPDQLKKLIACIDKFRDLGSGKPEKSTRAWLDAQTKDEKYLAAARRRLVDYGIAEELVARFPVDQVLLLDQKREYEVERDEAMKLTNVPTWKAMALYDKVQPAKEPALFGSLLPAMRKVRQAQARLDQRFALLRHVEALRLYAAEHDGKLPERLDEVGVPLPVDPLTGKPFRYKVEGKTAHLWGSPPPGEEKNPAYNIHYEITIQNVETGKEEGDKETGRQGDKETRREKRPAEVIHLAVSPIAAPKPALKYQLLPDVRELKPGNPVQWYVRCFAEQRNFFFGKEATEKRARYRSMPLAELPADKLRRYGGSALTQADWAARLSTPDWQVLQRVQTEGADLMLPELNPLRILAEALQVRLRAEVAERRFDNAVRTTKTMFALARHLGEHPTTAANRVGLSAADLALDTLEEMVLQPGCPNLYWALTDLPGPLVDLRKGVQGDRAIVTAELRSLRDDAPMTDAEIDKLVGRLSGRAGFARAQAGQAPRNLRSLLRELARDAEKVRAARVRLVETGCAKELVAKFSPVQVILLDEKRKFEFRRDEEMKLLALTPAQIDAMISKEAQRGGDGLFADLLPRVVESRQAQARLEQRIALLRHVEALRLYAAGHDGKLPEKLSDVGVPLPADPFTGKPFAYKLEGTAAHLRAGAPRGEEKNPAYNLHYEIIIRK